MNGRGTRRTLALTTAGLVTALSIATAPVATASVRAPVAGPTCWGDWCSGRDANDTLCARDATTLESAVITVRRTERTEEYGLSFGVPSGVTAEYKVTLAPDEAEVGVVELRWSPTCKTKWARVNTIDRSPMTEVHALQSGTRYEQAHATSGYDAESPEGIYYSPMIYSPDAQVQAAVEGQDLVRKGTVFG